jgi:hypothetical protein
MGYLQTAVILLCYVTKIELCSDIRTSLNLIPLGLVHARKATILTLARIVKIPTFGDLSQLVLLYVLPIGEVT